MVSVFISQRIPAPFSFPSKNTYGNHLYPIGVFYLFFILSPQTATNQVDRLDNRNNKYTDSKYHHSSSTKESPCPPISDLEVDEPVVVIVPSTLSVLSLYSSKAYYSFTQPCAYIGCATTRSNKAFNCLRNSCKSYSNRWGLPLLFNA